MFLLWSDNDLKLISYILLHFLTFSYIVCCPSIVPAMTSRILQTSDALERSPAETATVAWGWGLPPRQENDDQPIKRKEYTCFFQTKPCRMITVRRKQTRRSCGGCKSVRQMPLEQSLETECAQSFVLGWKPNSSSARRSWIQRFEQECKDYDSPWVGQPQ